MILIINREITSHFIFCNFMLTSVDKSDYYAIFKKQIRITYAFVSLILL